MASYEPPILSASAESYRRPLNLPSAWIASYDTVVQTIVVGETHQINKKQITLPRFLLLDGGGRERLEANIVYQFRGAINDIVCLESNHGHMPGSTKLVIVECHSCSASQKDPILVMMPRDRVALSIVDEPDPNYVGASRTAAPSTFLATPAVEMEKTIQGLGTLLVSEVTLDSEQAHSVVEYEDSDDCTLLANPTFLYPRFHTFAHRRKIRNHGAVNALLNLDPERNEDAEAIHEWLENYYYRVDNFVNPRFWCAVLHTNGVPHDECYLDEEKNPSWDDDTEDDTEPEDDDVTVVGVDC
ncbi:hypothetical protein C8R44DRAFT_869284 [Mycena epipterygia]|nr:hypothetical protein C8R44DRAFT_869284 [Mycena epipterygia]